MCESVLMAQVLIFGVLAFLFLQLAAGQDPECTNALSALENAVATSCTSIENPTIICTGECLDYYQDVFDNCAADVSIYIIIIIVVSH